MIVLALHGFTRGPQHLDAFAKACAEQGWSCLRPELAPRWAPILMNSTRHLNAIARRIAPRLQGESITIVGHSAGAAAGSWLATQLLQQRIEIKGIVMVDGNDSPNHLMKKAWTELQSTAIRAVLAPPSPCNRQGELEKFLQKNRPGSVTVIPGSGHGDIEVSPSQMYRRVCGDNSTAETKQEVLLAVITAIKDLQGPS